MVSSVLKREGQRACALICFKEKKKTKKEKDISELESNRKQKWYLQGNRNTQYFHSWANQYRKTNTIWSITDDAGQVWRKIKEVSKKFLEYYENLFSSQGPTGVAYCLDNLEPRVTVAMNTRLLRPFREDEVKFALSQMHPLKSPGLDGYTAGFIKICGIRWGQM